MKYDDVYNTYDARGDIHADTRFSVNSREEYFFWGGGIMLAFRVFSSRICNFFIYIFKAMHNE